MSPVANADASAPGRRPQRVARPAGRSGALGTTRPPVAVAADERPAGAAGLELVPTFPAAATRVEWLASLTGASTQGELAAIDAGSRSERVALLLFAETARALHQLLDATPVLDHAHRLTLMRRVERMMGWLEGGRSDADAAVTTLCRAFGAALAAAPSTPSAKE